MDEPKAKEKKKEISACADDWLAVFSLLPPSQLGLQIALLSERFDTLVDEHFKTRRWTLAFVRIWRKIGQNGTKEMQIVTSNWKPLPIPGRQIPDKVVGFERLILKYIDDTVAPFLHLFRPLFASCATNLAIESRSYRVLEFVAHEIIPMVRGGICGLKIMSGLLRYLRQFSTASILCDCPSLRSLCIGHSFPKFPADDSANASSAQAVAKWLCSPRADGVPKVLRCDFNSLNCKWTPRIEGLKTAFLNASSPVNFLIVIVWHQAFADVPLCMDAADIDRLCVPFCLDNERTRERLALKAFPLMRFLIVRSPIGRGDEQKWAIWEREAVEWEFDEQRNRILISANERRDG